MYGAFPWEALEDVQAGLTLARLVMQWAREARDRGGNPYTLDFAKEAQKILGDD
jgi:hypothetical protein